MSSWIVWVWRAQNHSTRWQSTSNDNYESTKMFDLTRFYCIASWIVQFLVWCAQQLRGDSQAPIVNIQWQLLRTEVTSESNQRQQRVIPIKDLYPTRNRLCWDSTHKRIGWRFYSQYLMMESGCEGFCFIYWAIFAMVGDGVAFNSGYGLVVAKTGVKPIEMWCFLFSAWKVMYM